MSMTFHGLGYARYEWRAFRQPQGSQTVLSLGPNATLVHNTQVSVISLLCRNKVGDY